MYSVEWQKRGLPHAHILIWLQYKITSNEINDVISAEIPDENVDKGLYDIVVKHMILYMIFLLLCCKIIFYLFIRKPVIQKQEDGAVKGNKTIKR